MGYGTGKIGYGGTQGLGMPVKYDEYYSAQDHALGPVTQGVFPTRTLGTPKAITLNTFTPKV